MNKSQLHKQEFYRSIKDLSTSELDYRLAENVKRTNQVIQTIAVLRDRLKTSTFENGKLEREKEVLVESITKR